MVPHTIFPQQYFCEAYVRILYSIYGSPNDTLYLHTHTNHTITTSSVMTSLAAALDVSEMGSNWKDVAQRDDDHDDDDGLYYTM